MAVDNVKRFRSCFICGVEMHEDHVVLEDSGRNQFFVRKDNKDALESFKQWFKNVYVKGIPQILSIIDYSISENGDNESICIVNKIIANLPNDKQPQNGSSVEE